MPKACRVKVLTERPRKRRGFYGNKGKKITDVNSSGVNNGVDLFYLQTRQLHQTKKWNT